MEDARWIAVTATVAHGIVLGLGALFFQHFARWIRNVSSESRFAFVWLNLVLFSLPTICIACTVVCWLGVLRSSLAVVYAFAVAPAIPILALLISRMCTDDRKE